MRRLEQKCADLEEKCDESQSHVKFAYKMIENQDAMILELRKEMEELRAAVRGRGDSVTDGSRTPSAESPPMLPATRVLSVDEALRLPRSESDKATVVGSSRREASEYAYSIPIAECNAAAASRI